jgi:hypothetical protein
MKRNPNARLIPVYPDQKTGRPYPFAQPQDVIGLTVADLTTHAGTYGMGGPGFFGVRLEGFTASTGPDEPPPLWLILRLWGSDGWLSIDGRPIRAGDDRDKINTRFDPHLPDDVVFGRDRSRSPQDILAALIPIPAKITAFEMQQHSGSITIGDVRIDILADPNDRPVFPGTSEVKVFDPADDLREAWVLADTPSVQV